MSEQTEHILVLTTCPGSITAKQVAQDLIANDIAACVNTFPGMQSYFKWGNKVNIADEFLLIIKSTRNRFKEIEKTILTLHPYELPEIIAIPIDEGLEGYLNWISNTTSK